MIWYITVEKMQLMKRHLRIVWKYVMSLSLKRPWRVRKRYNLLTMYCINMEWAVADQLIVYAIATWSLFTTTWRLFIFLGSDGISSLVYCLGSDTNLTCLSVSHVSVQCPLHAKFCWMCIQWEWIVSCLFTASRVSASPEFHLEERQVPVHRP